MKKLIYVYSIVLAALLIGLPVSAQSANEGIQFDSISFNAACAKAKAENKLIFVDCYVKTCTPCKMMARKVFPQKVCGDYFNKNFVCLMQDMDEGEGPALRKQYGVMIYPTFLFIKPNGSIVLKYEGGAVKDPITFVSRIKSALLATEMYEEYKKGRRDAAFLGNLLTRYLKFDARKAREIANESLANAPAEMFADPAIWSVLPKILNRTDGSAFRQMFDIRHQICSLKGRDTVLKALVKAYNDEFVCRYQSWYDYRPRIKDLDTLCVDNAPGAFMLRDKMLLFGKEMQKKNAKHGKH